jgi:hypothetical protein
MINRLLAVKDVRLTTAMEFDNLRARVVYLHFLWRIRMRYLTAALLILASSCSRSNNEETSRFHEDGRAKPIVTVASMIDTTSFDAPWSLSEEFTTTIAKQIASHGTIYVNSKDEPDYTENPFGSDLSWMKKEFRNQEFAVFLELVEHQNVPVAKAKNGAPNESNNLNMSVRVRVVDLRGATPKIVLQEMFKDSYFIPKTLMAPNYATTGWGTEEFRKTPMGIAHAHITDTIANRVSDYILLAKSR